MIRILNNNAKVLYNSIFYLMIVYIFTINLNIKLLTDTLISLMIILAMINVYNKKYNMKKIPKWVIFSIGGFLLPLAISCFISSDINESFKYFRRLIKNILPVFLIFYFINDKKKIEVLLCAFFCSVFIEIIYSLITYSNYFYDMLFNKLYYRMQGYPPEEGAWPTFMSFSMKLEILLPLIYIFILDKRVLYNKKILIIILFIGLIALFFNNTRMAWFIIMIIFIFLTCVYIKNIKQLLIIACVSTAFLSCIVYMQPLIQQRIIDVVHVRDGSSQLHYMFVQDSLVMIKEKPVLGWGMGQFAKNYNEKYRSDETNFLIKKFGEHLPIPYAHNMFIDITIDAGILGLFGYLFCYSNFLFFSIKDWYKYRSVSGLIFFVTIATFALHGFSEKTLDVKEIIIYQYSLLGMYLVYREYEIDEYIENKRLL